MGNDRSLGYSSNVGVSFVGWNDCDNLARICFREECTGADLPLSWV